MLLNCKRKLIPVETKFIYTMRHVADINCLVHVHGTITRLTFAYNQCPIIGNIEKLSLYNIVFCGFWLCINNVR